MAIILTRSQHVAEPASVKRRQFLKAGLGITASLAVPNAFANILTEPERKIALLNLHTGESVNATYWAEGQYQLDELAAINQVLRDHRTDEINNIDNNLIELLNLLHHKIDGKKPFDVISGYRSPKTNEKLRKHSSGVAKKSFHMLGMAIDIRLPGKQLSDLHKTALSLKAGGVGYYPKSGFIHVDTGRVRRWGG